MSFGDNLLSELSGGTLALLVVLVLWTWFSKGKDVEDTAEIELQFYDEYLMIYRPKRYYSEKVTRREYNKMYYSEITRSTYEKKNKMLYFFGTVDGKRYNYAKDGSLPEKPTFDKIAKGTMQYISTRNVPDVMQLIEEIEAHSPIKVEVLADY